MLGENGGLNGDLWLVIYIVLYLLFDIVGYNLEIVLLLVLWEVVLGVKVMVFILKESILLMVLLGS